MDRALSRVFRDTRPHSTPVNPPVLHVEDLLTALARKGIPLPFEMGAFLVLQATEQILARKAGEPIAKVSASTVWLTDDGEVMLGEAAPTRDESLASKALVELLGALLVRSAPGVPTMLLELVEQGPSDGAWTLGRLRDDLEAALLPLNRSATRRVLSRLLREVRREGDRGGRGPIPDARVVDRDVDALFGVEPAAEPEGDADARGAQDEPEVDVDDEQPAPRLRGAAPRQGAPSRQIEPRAAAPSGRSAPSAAVGHANRPGRPRRAEPSEPDTLSGSASPAAMLDDFERELDDGEGRSGVRVGVAFLIAAALLVLAYLVFARGGG